MKLFSALIFILLVSVPFIKVFAVSLNISPQKTTLAQPGEEFPVNIMFEINNAENKVYYFRGVFHKPGTTNYCGITWNGSSWFSGPYSTNDGWKQFLPITVLTSSWSGELKAKIDQGDTGCQDPGEYNFKIQRFTESGSSSFDTQPEVTVNIIIPTSTATPNPTPTLIPTVKPTNTPQIKPTSTPIITTVPTSARVMPTLTPALPTVTNIIKPTIPINDTDTEIDQISSPGAILGVQLKTASESGKVLEISQNKYRPYIISLAIVSMGTAILSFALILQKKINKI